MTTSDNEELAGASTTKPLLLCFSHLRWDFVYQRPQHLMTRLAREYRILFWEEPLFEARGEPAITRRTCPHSGVEIIAPALPAGLSQHAVAPILTRLLDETIERTGEPAVRWYYTPMMLGFSRHLRAGCTIYDCMDELANFDFAPPELLALEDELIGIADLIFTGGYSLYEAKRERHPDVHPFPSSVDVAHFRAARAMPSSGASRPRLGFYGVVDERMDLGLVERLADARPEWDIEIVGPIAKIDPATLPRRANLSYPGARRYEELPGCLARWDVALMPFAINEATRFISPTKTPEYLAGGRPVVSTSIIDVARHYGELEGVRIAASPDLFVEACDQALALVRGDGSWLAPVDALLAEMSWERTAAEMLALIREHAATSSSTAATPHRRYDWLVVGAGFAGAVMAERLAADGGQRVLVIDRRPHIAGNAYDRLDDAGILIHQYGPHIFHTNSDEIADYLSRFTKWRPYEHRVLAEVDGQRVPIPINRTTLNSIYGLALADDAAAETFLASLAEPVATIRTSADVVTSRVGRRLYETFFRGYTRKQWGLDPSELDKSVTARVPTRAGLDDRYFTDSFQAMPAEGYTAMFARMLDHPLIDVELGVDFEEVRDRIAYDGLVYTGPIDGYFGYRYGPLPYRSLRFEHRTIPQEQYQQVAVVNYPSEKVPWTRVTEYKHLTGQIAPQTSITYEYPAATGDPYYPIPRDENQALFKRYEALSLAERDVIFVGRLATYRYYNMDQVVGQALAAYRRLAPRLAAAEPADGAVVDAARAER